MPIDPSRIIGFSDDAELVKQVSADNPGALGRLGDHTDLQKWLPEKSKADIAGIVDASNAAGLPDGRIIEIIRAQLKDRIDSGLIDSIEDGKKQTSNLIESFKTMFMDKMKADVDYEARMYCQVLSEKNKALNNEINDIRIQISKLQKDAPELKQLKDTIVIKSAEQVDTLAKIKKLPESEQGKKIKLAVDEIIKTIPAAFKAVAEADTAKLFASQSGSKMETLKAQIAVCETLDALKMQGDAIKSSLSSHVSVLDRVRGNPYVNLKSVITATHMQIDRQFNTLKNLLSNPETVTAAAVESNVEVVRAFLAKSIESISKPKFEEGSDARKLQRETLSKLSGLDKTLKMVAKVKMDDLKVLKETAGGKLEKRMADLAPMAIQEQAQTQKFAVSR